MTQRLQIFAGQVPPIEKLIVVSPAAGAVGVNVYVYPPAAVVPVAVIIPVVVAMATLERSVVAGGKVIPSEAALSQEAIAPVSCKHKAIAVLTALVAEMTFDILDLTT